MSRNGLKRWALLGGPTLLGFLLGSAVFSLDRCDVRDRAIAARASADTSADARLAQVRKDLDDHLKDSGQLVKEWRGDQREFRSYFAVMITWMRMVSPGLKVPPPEMPITLRQAAPPEPEGGLHAAESVPPPVCPALGCGDDPAGILAITSP